MPWRRVIGGMLVTMVILAACSRQEPLPAAKPKAVVPRQKNFQTVWQDESQYIVTIVATDLAEMAYYASVRKPPGLDAGHPLVAVEEIPGSGPLTYRVTVALPEMPEFKCDLPIDHAIWAPATYRPLTVLLAGKLPLLAATKPGAPDLDLLATLTEPTPERLAQLDHKLSRELDEAFTMPALHEQAALLLAAFALREASGNFHQQRVELSRMTAHLAVADARRGGGPRTPAGQVAEAALTALYNDQADALRQIDTFGADEAFTPWRRALRTRVTQDYRPLAGAVSVTLLEKLEWFRAYADRVDTTLAWSRLGLPENWLQLADWSRIANGGRPSVGLGHVLLADSLKAELTESAQVYAIEEEQALSKNQFVDRLNVEPQRCVAARGPGREPLRILGWGLWAGFLQRHLCHTIAANFQFMYRSWGVEEESLEFRQRMDQAFGDLYLYPFVRRQNATKEEYYRKAQDEEMALVRSRPQVVPASSWNIIDYEVEFAPLYFPPPHPFINEWHRHNPPAGTVYDILPRLNHPSLLNLQQPAQMVARLEELHARAPCDANVAFNLLRVRDGEKAPPARILEVYGPMADYDRYVAARISRLAFVDPATREKWLRRWAEMEPVGWRELGDFQLQQGREAAAAEAYQRWVNESVDDVAVANSARWLVKYYERNQDPDRATGLANRAAATYAQEGLLTKAWLLENRRDFAGALVLFEQQTERYQDMGPLVGFLVRRRDDASADPRYERRLTEVLGDAVPNGLARFQPVPGTPPARGVIVHTSIPRIADVGLKVNDVIVAVRGFRVDGWREFKTIRGFGASEAEPYTLIVWRDGSYQKIGPLPADYRFGVDLPDYRKE